MEIIIAITLLIIALEGLYICTQLEKKEEVMPKETRRTVRGDFGNPLADTYRKNSKGQLKPIKPGAIMLGDDEKDEV